MSVDRKTPKGYRKAWNGGQPPEMTFDCWAVRDEKGLGYCRYPECDCEARGKANASAKGDSDA